MDYCGWKLTDTTHHREIGNSPWKRLDFAPGINHNRFREAGGVNSVSSAIKTRSKSKPRSVSNSRVRFPIRCKTWAQVTELKRKYLKPVEFGPKGQPIYDHEAVMKLLILPKDRQQ